MWRLCNPPGYHSFPTVGYTAGSFGSNFPICMRTFRSRKEYCIFKIFPDHSLFIVQTYLKILNEIILQLKKDFSA